MLRSIIFSWDFCYFKIISDKSTADDDITYMVTCDVIMHDDIIFNTLCLLLFVTFVIEILHNSQNFGILQYYFHHIIQQLMKMNIFYANAVYFEKQQKNQYF